MQPPEADDRRATTLIDRDGTRVAALLHDPALNDEPELLDAVTAAAGISLENARLHAELRARLEELRGSRARIVEAGQSERKRLERNLHDGAQQRLIALSLDLGRWEEALQDDSEESERLVRARHEIATSLEELRDVARGLHPAVVSGHGLEVALEQLVARGPVPVRPQRRGGSPAARAPRGGRLLPRLRGSGQHRQARAGDVCHRRRCLVARAASSSRSSTTGSAAPTRSCGSGLRGLADRVEALEGRLRVWSPKGGGTRLRAEIPCAS